MKPLRSNCSNSSGRAVTGYAKTARCLTFLSTNPASEEEGIYVKVKDGTASYGFHPHADREHTPPEFAKWLVSLARCCRKLPLRSSSPAAQTRRPAPTQ